ncbi:MAG: hypothetical protein RRZ84_07875 [Romboutsia sp.]
MKQRQLNKHQKRLFNAIKKDYDWDWIYLLLLEKAKLQNISERFSVTQLFTGFKYEISRINLCIRLIDIITENVYRKNQYINLNNIRRFLPMYYNKNNVEFLKDTLYIEKAYNLYCDLRKFHTRNWWD